MCRERREGERKKEGAPAYNRFMGSISLYPFTQVFSLHVLVTLPSAVCSVIRLFAALVTFRFVGSVFGVVV